MNELSVLSPAAAVAAAKTARATATALDGSSRSLATLSGGVDGWTGVAHDSFTAATAEVAARTTLLAEKSAAGARAIDDYATELALLTNRLATIDTGLADAQTRTRDVTLSLPEFHGANLAVENWTHQRAAVLAAFDDASTRLSQRLHALIDDIPNRPRTFGEHLDDAAHVVATTASSTVWLGFGWLVDADGWWADITAIPSQIVDQVTDPVQTLEDAIALDDWRDGRYGAAAATLGMAVVGKGITGGKVLGKTPGGRKVFGHDDRGRPLARGGSLLPQSLDEMIAGVDLERAEVNARAHTLERHVNVDDQYLIDRIEKGTLDPVTGTRDDSRPNATSRWADQRTAEAEITRGLNSVEADLRALPLGGEKIIVIPVPEDTGTIYFKDPEGLAVQGRVDSAKIIVVRGKDGQFFIKTAYLEGTR